MVIPVYEGEVKFVDAEGTAALVYEKTLYDSCYDYPYTNGYKFVKNPLWTICGACGCGTAVGCTIYYDYRTGFTYEPGTIAIYAID